MGDFKIYNYKPKLNISFNKVVRPIVFSNLPGYIISQDNDVFVNYNVTFTTSDFVLDAKVYLEISNDNDNWIILNQSGLTTPSAPSVNIQVGNLTGFIPKKNYVRLRGQVDQNSLVQYNDGVEYTLNIFNV